MTSAQGVLTSDLLEKLRTRRALDIGERLLRPPRRSINRYVRKVNEGQVVGNFEFLRGPRWNREKINVRVLSDRQELRVSERGNRLDCGSRH